MYQCLFQLKSDYEKLNSMHQVPTFIVDGVTLTQSVSNDISCLTVRCRESQLIYNITIILDVGLLVLMI